MTSHEKPAANSYGMLLHALSVGFKFLLILIMGWHLPLEALGVYGLFVASCEIAQHLMGAGYGPYAVRQLPALSPEHRAHLVVSQGSFQLGAAALVLPACMLLFVLRVLPFEVACWFFPTLVGLFIGREATRLLVAVGKPLPAHVVSTAGQGLWIPLPLAVFALSPEHFNLQLVLGTWALAAASSALLAGFLLARQGLLSRAGRVRATHLRAGLRTAPVFLLLPLFAQLVLFSDRYFVAGFWGDGAAGVFTFHSSIARVLETLVFTGFVAPALPEFVRCFSAGDEAGYRAVRGWLSRVLLWASAALGSAFALGIVWPLQLLDRPGLVEALPVFFILLGRSALANLAQVPYLTLFAAHRNRALLLTAAAPVVLNLALNAWLVPRFALVGAALATLFSTVLQVVMLFASARGQSPGSVSASSSAAEQPAS